MSSVVTSCGNLTPQTYETINFGTPNIQQGHIPYFHSMMCQWAYNIAQSFSFVIVIAEQPNSSLIAKIASSMTNLEPTGWDTQGIVSDTWTDATQNVIGCIFAEGVRIPGESIGIERVGIKEGSSRGFINAPIVTGRTEFDPLEIGFMETNQSFTDGVLRPWMIITAHEGLIAQKDSIKADISVYQLARVGDAEMDNPQPNIIRKHWVFKDCVPSNIGSEELTYGNSGSYPKKQVQFIYNSYSLQGTSGN